jgi:biopolymer transport protein ExbD
VIERPCPRCGAVLRLPVQFQGRLVRCTNCHATFQLQDDGVAVPAAWAAGEEGLPTLDPVPPPVQLTPPALQSTAQANPTFAMPLEYQAAPARPRPKSPRRSLPEAEMDMTPMVDVTFLLLIFFMVTASFAMQKSLNIPKPQTDEPSTQVESVQDFQDNPEYVVVRVDSLNTYHISASAWPDEIEAPSEQELLVKLRQARQGDAQGNVPSKMLVIANGEALHERVVTAVDAGNEVGMEEVQLLTVEEDDQ